jgi:hypothetical protein
MFPTAGSVIYRNEAGEVLGWDTYYGDEEPYEDDFDRDRADAYYEEMAERAEEAEDDEDDECEGHESLDGAHMGESVYCDGSCRR